MAKQKKSFTANSGELSTIIGHDAKLTGELRTEASMRIDGEVKGELESSDTITVGKDGIVEGDIKARDIVIGGRIIGKLVASGKVVLESNAALDGDLSANRLVIEEGAAFNGNCDMRSGSSSGQIKKGSKPPKINLTEDD